MATRSAKKSPSARLDRAAVLEASRRIVNRDGFHELTIAALATELDRHASSLYNHVDGLEGLRRDVVVIALRELGQRLRDAVLGRGGAAGLRALADAYREFARTEPGLFEAATSWRKASVHVDELRDAAESAGQAIHAVMRSFGLEDDDVIHATRAFSGAVVGFIRAENQTYGDPGPNLDDTFNRLIDLFVLGLSGGWPARHNDS
ncbi:MAG TPA: WHG domain-containing protein [Acidimicrobiales bacterium]